jgi:hypothetical protein
MTLIQIPPHGHTCVRFVYPLVVVTVTLSVQV